MAYTKCQKEEVDIMEFLKRELFLHMDVLINSYTKEIVIGVRREDGIIEVDTYCKNGYITYLHTVHSDGFDLIENAASMKEEDLKNALADVVDVDNIMIRVDEKEYKVDSAGAFTVGRRKVGAMKDGCNVYLLVDVLLCHDKNMVLHSFLEIDGEKFKVYDDAYKAGDKGLLKLASIVLNNDCLEDGFDGFECFTNMLTIPSSCGDVCEYKGDKGVHLNVLRRDIVFTYSAYDSDDVFKDYRQDGNFISLNDDELISIVKSSIMDNGYASGFLATSIIDRAAVTIPVSVFLCPDSTTRYLNLVEELKEEVRKNI